MGIEARGKAHRTARIGGLLVKQTPELDRVQEHMQPGAITRDGFLGEDTRKLVDIIQADAVAVREAGLTHGAIADALEDMTRKGVHLMEHEVEVDGRYKVRVRDDRGKLPSPWGDGLFIKGDTEMHDPVTGRTFRWNGLTTHMIRTHGFYNGKGAYFRIDPEAIIETLGLTPTEEPPRREEYPPEIQDAIE